MNPVKNLLNKLRSNAESRSIDRGDLFGPMMSGGSTAGQSVNETTAMRLSAVFACVRVLSESVASLPWHLYEREESGTGKSVARAHPLYRLLHDQPNPFMTSFDFRSTIMSHLSLYGNAYVEIQRDRAQRIVALWPVTPTNMEVLISPDGEKGFRHTPSGKLLTTRDIWHVTGLSLDGYTGLGVISLQRQGIGLAMAAEEYGARLYENDSRPRGVLQHPGNMSKEAQERFRESWENLHRGTHNAGKTAILEEGMEFKPISIPPEDAQFIETRKFQTAEIARIFRVPLHMINDLDRATFSNIEHQSVEFVRDTLRPWLTRIEMSANQYLLSEGERERYFTEFSVDGLLRGDTANRWEAYTKALGWGVMSINEVRSKENLNQLPGEVGDHHLVPLNMQPAEMIGQEPTAPVNDQRSESRSLPTEAEYRSAATRRKAVEHDFDDLFVDAATKTVKRERGDILRQLKKATSQRSAESLSTYITDYYEGESSEFIRSNFGPVFKALFRSISRMAADEISAPVNTEALTQWQREYIDTFLWRYRDRSRRQLLALLQEEREHFDEAIEQRLDEWVERRPEKVAMEEAVRASSAVAKTVWAGAGIQTLRWVTVGDTCPHCRALDGKTVSMRDFFVRADESLDNEGETLTPTTNIGNPPLHAGCDCTITPGGF